MKTIYLVDEYWLNIQEYVAAGTFETSYGWVLIIPRTQDFKTGICMLVGLDRDAFEWSPNRPFIRKLSIHVELRAHWNKTSKILMAISEIAQRARRFPLMLNILTNIQW